VRVALRPCAGLTPCEEVADGDGRARTAGSPSTLGGLQTQLETQPETKKKRKRPGRGARGRINKKKAREERQREFAEAATATAIQCVIYFVLNPALIMGGQTLRELINEGKKTCRGEHVEILRVEQVENLVAILGGLDVRVAGHQRFSSTQRMRSDLLADWVEEQGYVHLEKDISVWLLFAADRHGGNQLVAEFRIRALATVQWAGENCDKVDDDVSWVADALEELGAGPRAPRRLAVVGNLRPLENRVSVARTSAHRDGGPHHIPLDVFLDQVRSQGGMFRD
jgi:hypothetical protein